MRIWAILIVLACQSSPPVPEKSCIDKELEKRGLNEFGDAKGTMYPGGTPLFHEATGKTTTREEYLQQKHPEISAACKQ
jgi:hypothetical protein